MALTGSLGRISMSKCKISRLGRKLQTSDDPRTLLALPKDVPERIWAEILQREENELVCFEIREEIFDAAMSIGYDRYMEKQTTFFTVHCTASALLKLIDWHFYRHDPGEDPSAYPPCFIPKRKESWTPDELPPPATKDTWAVQDLKYVEPTVEEAAVPIQQLGEAGFIQFPIIAPIPEEYMFPGKVNLTTIYITKDGVTKRHVMDEDPHHKRPDVELVGENSVWYFVERVSETPSTITTSSKMEVADSEVLQKITDYPQHETSLTPDSKYSSPKQVTPVDGSLQGAGDSTIQATAEKRYKDFKAKTMASSCSVKGRWSHRKSSMFKSRLPPLMAASLSRVTLISDCRLRNLRMETQYEISEEKLNSLFSESDRKK